MPTVIPGRANVMKWTLFSALLCSAHTSTVVDTATEAVSGAGKYPEAPGSTFSRTTYRVPMLDEGPSDDAFMEHYVPDTGSGPDLLFLFASGTRYIQYQREDGTVETLEPGEWIGAAGKRCIKGVRIVEARPGTCVEKYLKEAVFSPCSVTIDGEIRIVCLRLDSMTPGEDEIQSTSDSVDNQMTATKPSGGQDSEWVKEKVAALTMDNVKRDEPEVLLPLEMEDDATLDLYPHLPLAHLPFEMIYMIMEQMDPATCYNFLAATRMTLDSRLCDLVLRRAARELDKHDLVTKRDRIEVEEQLLRPVQRCLQDYVGLSSSAGDAFSAERCSHIAQNVPDAFEKCAALVSEERLGRALWEENCMAAFFADDALLYLWMHLPKTFHHKYQDIAFRAAVRHSRLAIMMVVTRRKILVSAQNHPKLVDSICASSGTRTYEWFAPDFQRNSMFVDKAVANGNLELLKHLETVDGAYIRNNLVRLCELAAAHGDVAVFEHLFNKLSRWTRDDEIVLAAAKHGNTEILARIFPTSHATEHHSRRYYVSVVTLAMEEKHYETAKFLLTGKVDGKSLWSSVAPMLSSGAGAEDLLLAVCEKEDVQGMGILLGKGPDGKFLLSSLDQLDCLLFEVAITSGKPAMIKYLVDRIADGTDERFAELPFEAACALLTSSVQHGWLEIFQYLLDEKSCGNAKFQDVYPSLVQEEVIERNDVRFVKELFRQKVGGSGLEFKDLKVSEALVQAKERSSNEEIIGFLEQLQ